MGSWGEGIYVCSLHSLQEIPVIVYVNCVCIADAQFIHKMHLSKDGESETEGA